MNVDLQTLAIISGLTAITTECIKNMLRTLDKPYISNIIAAVVAAVLSLVIVVVKPVVVDGAYFGAEILFNGLVMAFLSVLTANLGFDKVVQTIEKLKG